MSYSKYLSGASERVERDFFKGRGGREGGRKGKIKRGKTEMPVNH